MVLQNDWWLTRLIVIVLAAAMVVVFFVFFVFFAFAKASGGCSSIEQNGAIMGLDIQVAKIKGDFIGYCTLEIHQFGLAE